MDVIENHNPPLDFYDQLVIRFEPRYGIMWYYMNPKPRPCFTPQLLSDLRKFHRSIKNHGGVVHTIDGEVPITCLVLGSIVPGTFNLGGDLGLFIDLIKAKDRKELLRYARACIEPGYESSANLGLPLTTISLVQGDALGGGFEAALSSTILIAEKSAKLGFPEILFNLFPGMGAFSFLARRVSASHAERMISNGNIYTAAELYEMGIVDVLAEDGEGRDVVYAYAKKVDRYKNARQAISRIRQRYHAVTYDELIDIANIWVDTALGLAQKDIRIMERLVKAQYKKVGGRLAFNNYG